MFWSGAAAGLGIGLAVGLALGVFLLRSGLDTIQMVVEKVAYSLRFPRNPVNPVQVTVETEEQYKTLDEDEERVPDWMSDEFVMPRG